MISTAATTRGPAISRCSRNVPRCCAVAALRLAARSTLIDPDGPVRGFAPRALCDEIAVDYISHTSTVVLRAPWVETLRFDTDLRSAGEDRMFWLDLGWRGRGSRSRGGAT
jgi:hypothetical protein